MPKMTETETADLHRLLLAALAEATDRLASLCDAAPTVSRHADALRVVVDSVADAWAFASILTRLHMAEERETADEDHQRLSRIILRPHVLRGGTTIAWYYGSDY